MILLIWSIYILISAKLQISKTYGVKGGIARLVGVFYLLISFGLVGAFIPLPIEDPVQNILVSFGIQLGLIIMAPLIAVAIHGNDFEKAKETLKESIDSSAASYCPKCKTNYREGFTVCADCGVDLVPHDKQI